MAVIVSAVLAYVYLGLRAVQDAFKKDAFNRPFWTMHPTVGMGLFYGASWPWTHFRDAKMEVGFHDPKAPWVGAFTAITALTGQTAVFWGAYTLAWDLASASVSRVLLLLLFVVLGNLIIRPMIGIAGVAVGGLVLAIAFPTRNPKP